MSPSTLPSSLPEDSNGKGILEAIGETTHQIEPEKEKRTVEFNTPSTMASSSVNDVDDGPATEEKAADEPPKPVMEYPKGIEALFIMAALVLSITLCSLDQVSSTDPSFS
jgi:MFS transporter, DHA2 family, glioxin efflux transporter